MEKALDETLQGASNVETEPTSTLGPEYDLDLSGIETEVDETTVDAEEDQGVTPVETPQANNPTNVAFAQMRTRNKQLEGVYNDLNEIAKSVGLANAEEFITKAKAQREVKDAAAKGIPVELDREIKALTEEIRSMKEERANEIKHSKERTLAQTLQGFVKDNKLSNEDVNTLGNALERDGLPMSVLMEMSPSAQKKIFKAYYGNDTNKQSQKQLERKNAIKNELPISQTSKAPIDLNKAIDDLAKQMAGKM